MHYRFFIKINRITIRAISWYILKDFSYSKIYSLNCALKHVSANPVPRTRLDLDWISVPNKDRIKRSKPFEVLDTPPHYVTNWNLNSLRNFAKFLDLDLINAWASKESSNFKIIRDIRRYNLSREFSRVVFYKIPLLRMDRPKGFQLLVQLKIRNVLN
jgi:hypothetical protein